MIGVRPVSRSTVVSQSDTHRVSEVRPSPPVASRSRTGGRSPLSEKLPALLTKYLAWATAEPVLGRAKWYALRKIPCFSAPAQLVLRVGSAYVDPSVAFMKANVTPAASTFGQDTVPWWCEMSIPSA